ncbi:MAG: hypothetical protein WC997_05040 [Porticoccaceae bacterium]
MRKSKSGRRFTFALIMMTCVAFLVGMVKVWGVAPETLWEALGAIFVFLGAMMVVAVGAALLLILWRKWRDGM